MKSCRNRTRLAFLCWMKTERFTRAVPCELLHWWSSAQLWGESVTKEVCLGLTPNRAHAYYRLMTRIYPLPIPFCVASKRTGWAKDNYAPGQMPGAGHA